MYRILQITKKYVWPNKISKIIYNFTINRKIVFIFFMYFIINLEMVTQAVEFTYNEFQTIVKINT